MGDELETRVIYTTKELLGRIDAKLDLLYAKLDAKADKVEFLPLLARLAVLEAFQERVMLTETQRNLPQLARGEKYMTYVDELRQNSVTTAAMTSYRKYLVTSLITGIGSSVGLVGVILAHTLSK